MQKLMDDLLRKVVGSVPTTRIAADAMIVQVQFVPRTIRCDRLRMI
jgi:hypothetical protein